MNATIIKSYNKDDNTISILNNFIITILILLFSMNSAAHAESVFLSIGPVDYDQATKWDCGIHGSYRILKYGYNKPVNYFDMISQIGPWEATTKIVLVPNLIEFTLDFGSLAMGQPPVVLASKLRDYYMSSAVDEARASTDRIKDLLWQGIPVLVLTQVGHNGCNGQNLTCNFDGCVGAWVFGSCWGFEYSVSGDYPTSHYWVLVGYDDQYVYLQSNDNTPNIMKWSDFENLRSFNGETDGGDIVAGQHYGASFLSKIKGTRYFSEAINFYENNGATIGHIVHFNQPLSIDKIEKYGERYPVLSVTPPWGVTIKSNDGAINCGKDCSNQYLVNSDVTLTMPDLPSDASVKSWNVTCQPPSGNLDCTIKLDQSYSVRPTINCPSCYSRILPAISSILEDTDTQSLNITKIGSGNGTVLSSNNLINCGATCSANVTKGNQVKLAALSSSGNKFVEWSGGSCTGNQVCSVTMNTNQNVTAKFDKSTENYNLSINLVGTGSGVVASDSGISCSSNCTKTLISGSSITLSAAPSASSIFEGWSGDCSGNGNCILNIKSASNVTATFNVGPLDGVCGASGGGTFTAIPITNLCSKGTASLVSGSGPWTWTCAGTNGGKTAPCSANIQSFDLVFKGGGNGTVTGITSQAIKYGGSASSVTAVPSMGYHFANWTGSNGFIATTDNPLTLKNITASYAITANFIADNISEDGVCGSSNGATTSSAPVANLCALGNASTVIGNGPWTWTCQGNNGGKTSNCSANKAGSAATFKITTSVASGNGIINCTSPVEKGTTSNCIITPAGGYQLATFTDNGDNKLSSVKNNSYAITNVTVDHTIVGGFDKTPELAISITSTTDLKASYKGGKGTIAFTFTGNATPDTINALISKNDWIKTATPKIKGNAGTIAYTVIINTSAARIGSIKIGGNTISVAQDAPPCKITTATASTVPNSGGAVAINVSVDHDFCTWSVTSIKAGGETWLSDVLNVTKTGNGTITAKATENTTGKPRSTSANIVTGDGKSKKSVTIKQDK